MSTLIYEKEQKRHKINPSEEYELLFYEKEKWRKRCIEQQENYLKLIRDLQNRLIEYQEIIDLS